MNGRILSGNVKNVGHVSKAVKRTCKAGGGCTFFSAMKLELLWGRLCDQQQWCDIHHSPKAHPGCCKDPKAQTVENRLGGWNP